MNSTKRFNQRENRLAKQRRNQLGNSLVPVIIALGISAIATVGFLKQGSKLSDKNKALSAQFELVDIMQNWKTFTKYTKMGHTMPTPTFMTGKNAFGNDLDFRAGTPATAKNNFTDTGVAKLSFTTGNLETCETLRNTFNENFEGIARSKCDQATLRMLLNSGN